MITPLKQSEEDSLDTASASGTEDYEEEDSSDSLNTASEEVQDETSYEDTSAQPYEDSVTDTMLSMESIWNTMNEYEHID